MITLIKPTNYKTNYKTASTVPAHVQLMHERENLSLAVLNKIQYYPNVIFVN